MPLNTKPSWSDLTPAQQKNFGNGVGSKKWPAWVRYALTKEFDFFFIEASHRHHDFGYAVGCTEADRKRCDRLFYEAMRRDAFKQPWWKMPFAYICAKIIYQLVRWGGREHFYYAENYRTLNEILAHLPVGFLMPSQMVKEK